MNTLWDRYIPHKSLHTTQLSLSLSLSLSECMHAPGHSTATHPRPTHRRIHRPVAPPQPSGHSENHFWWHVRLRRQNSPCVDNVLGKHSSCLENVKPLIDKNQLQGLYPNSELTLASHPDRLRPPWLCPTWPRAGISTSWRALGKGLVAWGRAIMPEDKPIPL